jgi:hypothetical protein
MNEKPAMATDHPSPSVSILDRHRTGLFVTGMLPLSTAWMMLKTRDESRWTTA